MQTVFALLIAFQAKHFLADYPLQTPYMLGKFKEQGWVKPLLAHSAVHAGGTFIISVVASSHVLLAALLALLDLSIHFMVDRIKASPKYLGRFNPSQPYFWWSLGADQMAHHLTHYFVIYILLASLSS